jgi:serine/threonine-protein kinase
MGANLFKTGDMCGGNEVVRLVGAGGFAQVYEVKDPTGARRALKIIATEPSARPKLHARLAQEGAALAMIEHVNVVRLHDAGVHEDHVWLLLELIHGKNLREALRAQGGRAPIETTLRWLRQACEGVAAAHKIGVVHRDLKPENILVTGSELVKVIDFGIAKFTSWGVKTTQEQRVGSALYMSPEHIQGKAPDPRMDVYAMGILLYEALAGVHPIAAEPATMIDICARQLNRRPAPLDEVAPEVPPALAALVARAMEKDPERRFPGMPALSDALHEALLLLAADRRAVVAQLIQPPPAPSALEDPDRTTVEVVAPASAVDTVTVEVEAAPARVDETVTVPVGTRGEETVTTPCAPESTTATIAVAPEEGLASRAPLVAVVVAALLAGIGGGVWLALRVLAP